MKSNALGDYDAIINLILMHRRIENPNQSHSHTLKKDQTTCVRQVKTGLERTKVTKPLGRKSMISEFNRKQSSETRKTRQDKYKKCRAEKKVTLEED